MRVGWVLMFVCVVYRVRMSCSVVGSRLVHQVHNVTSISSGRWSYRADRSDLILACGYDVRPLSVGTGNGNAKAGRA